MDNTSNNFIKSLITSFAQTPRKLIIQMRLTCANLGLLLTAPNRFSSNRAMTAGPRFWTPGNSTTHTLQCTLTGSRDWSSLIMMHRRPECTWRAIDVTFDGRRALRLTEGGFVEGKSIFIRSDGWQIRLKLFW